MSLSLYGLIYKFAGEEKDFANKMFFFTKIIYTVTRSFFDYITHVSTYFFSVVTSTE